METLAERVRELGPWHMDIPVSGDLRTSDLNPYGQTGVIDPRELQPLLGQLYPDGLRGKRFLDCACNAGGYSLLASDLGADYCFGFDAREHWIAQARLLKELGNKRDDEVRFEVWDLLEVGRRLERERFDICLFKGIFYHLPDPMASLKVVADLTDDVVILDTATGSGADDGFLKLVWEGTENRMSGVHRLAWRPTGPQVLAGILEWLGFEATRVVFWRHSARDPNSAGRIRIVGARDPCFLEHLVPAT